DQRIEPQRKLTLCRARIGLEYHLRDDEAEHPVAEELETLVVIPFPALRAGMGQRAAQEVEVGKGKAGDRLDRLGERLAGLRLAGHHATSDLSLCLSIGFCFGCYRTMLNRREGRISAGHRHTSSGLAPPAMEKKMMLARPTRWSSGTKPTEKR